MKKVDPHIDRITPLLARIEALERRLDSQAEQHAAEIEAQKATFEAKLNDFSGALNSLRRIESLRPHFTPGMIAMLATSTLPPGWLLCDGKEYACEKYPELFRVIGDCYNQSTAAGCFAVPDMRDRIPFCAELGHTSGAWNMHLQACHLPHHVHGIDVSTASMNLQHSHGAEIHGGGEHFHHVKKYADAKNKGNHLAFKHALRSEQAWERDFDLRIPHDPHSGRQYPDGAHSHTASIHPALREIHHSHTAAIISTNEAQQVHGQAFSVRNPVFGVLFYICAKSFLD